MKILEKEINKRGFCYKQIKRVGNVCIYSVNKNGKVFGHEVFVVQSHNGYSIGDVDIPASEMYPKDSAFGDTAWYYMINEGDSLNKKFNFLIKSQDNV